MAAANIIAEFFTAIRFVADEGSARRVENTARRVERTVREADQAVTRQSIAGSARRQVGAMRERGARKLATSLHIAEIKRLVGAQKTAEDSAVKSAARRGLAEAKTNADRLRWQQRLSQIEKREERERTQEAVAGAKARTVALSSFGAGVGAVTTLVAGLAAAAGGAYAVMTKMAGASEEMFYTSKRTGASAAGLRSFGYAAEQTGSSATEAMATMEGLAQKLKAMPGFDTMLENLGVPKRDQNGDVIEFTKRMMILGDVLKKMPEPQRYAYADSLGVPSTLVQSLTDPAFRKAYQENQKMMADAGIDPAQADRDSKAYMDAYRRLMTSVSVVATKVQGALVKAFGEPLEDFTKYIIKNADSIANGAVKIGEGILYVVKGGVDFVKWVNSLSPATKDAAIGIGALSAAAMFLRTGPIGAILALGGALAAVLGDYRKWRDGSKDTFIDWDKWEPIIKSAIDWMVRLGQTFDTAVRSLTGESGLTAAVAILGLAITSKLLGPLGKAVGLMGQLSASKPPFWLLRLLGVAAVGAVVADDVIKNSTPEGRAKVIEEGEAAINREQGGKTGAQRGWVGRGMDAVTGALGIGGAQAAPGVPADTRTFREKVLPEVLGGKPAPAAGGAAPGSPGSLGSVDATVLDRKMHYPGASDVGKQRIASWFDFFQKPESQGGMGADAGTARAMVAMMQGESSVNLNPASVGSVGEIGTAQWYRGRSNKLRTRAIREGLPWQDVGVQQRHWREEALGDYKSTWEAIKKAKTEEEKLNIGIRQFEVPKKPDEALQFRMVHLRRLQQMGAGNGGPQPTPAPVSAMPPYSVSTVRPSEAQGVPEWRRKAEEAGSNFNARFNDSMFGRDGSGNLKSSAPALGVGPQTMNSTNNSVKTGDTNITVNGVLDPKEAAETVGRTMRNRDADVLRNMKSAFA